MHESSQCAREARIGEWWQGERYTLNTGLTRHVNETCKLNLTVCSSSRRRSDAIYLRVSEGSVGTEAVKANFDPTVLKCKV